MTNYMKKEKLEQMKELGRGGLSKGLSFLRNAAAASGSTGAGEDGEDSASERDSITSDRGSITTSNTITADGGSAPTNGGAKPTYEQLLQLSLKYNRQNKMMRDQLQKMQTRIQELQEKSADAALLSMFITEEVGVDLVACHTTQPKPPGNDGGVYSTYDVEQINERYRILQALKDKERKQELEKKIRAELDSDGANGAAVTLPSGDKEVENNGAYSVSLLPLSPTEKTPTSSAATKDYVEIDLLNDSLPSQSQKPEQIATLEKEIEEVTSQLYRLQEQLQAKSMENETLTQKIDDLCQQRSEEMSALTHEKLTLEERIAELMRTIEAHNQSQEELQQQWNDQSQTLAQVQERLEIKASLENKLTAEIADANAKIDELLQARDGQSDIDKVDQDQLANQVKELQDSIISLQREKIEIHSTLEVKETELATLHTSFAELQQENMSLQEKLTDSSMSLQEDASNTTDSSNLKHSLGELQHEKDRLEKLLEEQNIASAQREKELDELRNALSTLKEEKSGVEKQLEQLREHSSTTYPDREKEITDLNNQIQKLKEQFAPLKQANEDLLQKLEAEKTNDNAAEMGPLMQELEKVKMERAEIDHTVRNLKEQLRISDEKLQKAQEDIERSNSLVEGLQEATNRLVDEVELYKQAHTTSEHEYTKLQSEMNAVVESKEVLEEELQTLRRDTHANLESTIAEVTSRQNEVEEAKMEKVKIEKQMAEERGYLNSKVESLIKELETVSKINERLQSTLAEREKQVQKMTSSQTSMTSEMMELQKQLSSMRQDLHMAAEALEAHATKAEQNDLLRRETEEKMMNLKLQMDSMRDNHMNDFEMLRKEKDAEVDRIKQDRNAVAQKLREAEALREELQARFINLEHEYAEQKSRMLELESTISRQTYELGNLSLDLAETKKALSDRMALATRLQTENMGIAGKQAEQAALIESALHEAAESKAMQKEMETKMKATIVEMERIERTKKDLVAEMKQMEANMMKEREQMKADQEEAIVKHQLAVDAEKSAFKREVARVEAESKHKSKLALQAVLEKEAEIERLSRRLAELEEDVRSGDADNRKIFEFAQLQANREAEFRAQTMKLQEMGQQLEAARQEIKRVQEEKTQYEQELTTLMQTQRREGVNMEYLKNVVVQYMSFRPGSSQQSRLIPVLTTLLQFTAADIKEIKRAAVDRRSSWTSWGSEKDYKPLVVGAGHQHPMIPMSPAPSRIDEDRPTANSSRMSEVNSSAPPSRASSFNLPNGFDTTSDPSAFSPHAARESADF